ncbi:MAG TPA: hypothetical protein VHE83_15035 [Mycobacteriales bacterium]|nr:hypothetical protein [Mycobacteriales bacterium]
MPAAARAARTPHRFPRMAEVLEEHLVARRRRWRDRFLTVRGLVVYGDHVEVVVTYRYREDELAAFIAAVDDGGRERPELPQPTITLRDDVGTTYARVETHKTGGQRATLTVLFTPPVPQTATRVSVLVDGVLVEEVPRTVVAQDV